MTRLWAAASVCLAGALVAGCSGLSLPDLGEPSKGGAAEPVVSVPPAVPASTQAAAPAPEKSASTSKLPVSVDGASLSQQPQDDDKGGATVGRYSVDGAQVEVTLVADTTDVDGLIAQLENPVDVAQGKCGELKGGLSIGCYQRLGGGMVAISGDGTGLKTQRLARFADALYKQL